LVLGEERDFMANAKDSGEQVQVIKIVADDVALQLSRIESITFQQARAREEAPA
jgi:single-strand DNA-binding protein